MSILNGFSKFFECCIYYIKSHNTNTTTQTNGQTDKRTNKPSPHSSMSPQQYTAHNTAMTTTSVIKIKIILILRHTMYYTVTMYSTHYKSSCGSFDECKQRHMAADPQTKPTDLGHESACRLLESTPTITTVLNRKLILTLMYTEGVPKVRVAFTSRRTWSLRDLMSHTEITAKALSVLSALRQPTQTTTPNYNRRKMYK